VEKGVGHVQEEAVPGAFIFCSVVPCVVGQVPDEGDGESRRCIFFAVGAKPRKAKQLTCFSRDSLAFPSLKPWAFRYLLRFGMAIIYFNSARFI
jgi:hypothetical protein